MEVTEAILRLFLLLFLIVICGRVECLDEEPQIFVDDGPDRKNFVA